MSYFTRKYGQSVYIPDCFNRLGFVRMTIQACLGTILLIIPYVQNGNWEVLAGYIWLNVVSSNPFLWWYKNRFKLYWNQIWPFAIAFMHIVRKFIQANLT